MVKGLPTLARLVPALASGRAFTSAREGNLKP